MKREFPPRAIADLTQDSAGQFLSLAKAIKQGPFTITLGAGVSASAGLPPWNLLLRRIAATYFCHWEFEKKRGLGDNSKPPRNISVAFWEDNFWGESTRQAANNLVSREDALRAAQMIKSRIRPRDWNYLVRKALYGNATPRAPSALLMALASLCSTPTLDVELLSYNYDNLIEVALSGVGVYFSSVYKPGQGSKPGTIPIFYPHGYLRPDGGPTVTIVLGEEDYHEYAVNQYGWHNAVQLRSFSRSTCIFVGFSLTDPQVRRLLWVAKQGGVEIHYAFLSTSTDKDEMTEMLESLIDAQLRDLNVRVIRYCAGKNGQDHTRLTELISLLGRGAVNPCELWA